MIIANNINRIPLHSVTVSNVSELISFSVHKVYDNGFNNIAVNDIRKECLNLRKEITDKCKYK